MLCKQFTLNAKKGKAEGLVDIYMYTYNNDTYKPFYKGYMMFNPSLGFVLLFVKNPLNSVRFYEEILVLKPVQQSPTFVMFALSNGVILGLWSYKTANPDVIAQPGASEIAFAHQDIDGLYAQWKKMGITIAQEPTDMSFGRTFTVLDPDGHRIRIYALPGGH